MPIPAGAFDPIPAQFYYNVQTYVNNEPVLTPTLFYETWIRFPNTARTGVEVIVAKQTLAHGQTIIRVRRDSSSVQLDPSMHMIHNSKTYGIICINEIPSSERDEIELLVQYQIPSTLRTT